MCEDFILNISMSVNPSHSFVHKQEKRFQPKTVQTHPLPENAYSLPLMLPQLKNKAGTEWQ